MKADKILDEHQIRISKNRKTIKDFYNRTLKELNDNNIKKAKVILYSEMPGNLYDLSLDIQDNRNSFFTDKKLRNLIKKVHSLLDNEEEEIEDFVEDDNFGGFI